MSSQKKHGKLRLAVRIRSTAWLAAGWTALAAVVALLIFQIATHRRLTFALMGAVVPILVYVLHPRLRFFENGVEIPPTRNVTQLRFLEWGQIDHYSWDGDHLILAGTQAILSGGPVEGDTLPISRPNKTRVELLLAEKLGRPVA